MTTFIEIDGIKIETDSQGFLINKDQWNESVCKFMADQDHCELTDVHWQVIHFLRHYYEEYNHSPAMRIFIKALREVIGEEAANSQNLYQLFPYGPAKQATRYAGLPKPAHCI